MDPSTAVPSWLYFLSGFMVWFYQTMDAVDGKQARRTNSSSPLGQLFDHGCDGLQTLIVTLQLTVALQLNMPSTLLLVTFI